MANRWEKMERVTDFIFLGSKITEDSDWTMKLLTAAMKLKDACSLEEKLKPIQSIKKQRHQFASKGLYSQSYGFSSSHVKMWELDHKVDWVLNNWCFQTVGLEKTLESLLDCKEIKPVNPKGTQSWIFSGRTDAEPEAPILWPPDAKSMMFIKTEGRREEGNSRWDGWMALLTQWTRVWANSGRQWRTGTLGVL